MKVLASFLPIVLILVLQNKVTSANNCSSTPIVINGSASGTFSSPNYPNNYPHNTIKIWKIEAPVGQVISLYFAVFSLEESRFCLGADYVKILDKCNDTIPKAVYCDHKTRPVRSGSNVLWVEFRSDHSRNDKGFQAIYIMSSDTNELISCPRPSDNQANIDYCYVNNQVQCCNRDETKCQVDKILAAESGKITSPGYPGNYPHGTFFLWRITVPEGYVVQINFTTLVTYHTSECSNSMSNCNCDYIQAVDGPCRYNTGPRWCGAWTSRNQYPSYITTGRHMVLVFRSDLTNNHVGFVAEYRRALKCSGDKPISCVTNGKPSCCLPDATACTSDTSTRSHCPRDEDLPSYKGCCIINGSPSCCTVLESSKSRSCPRLSDNQAFIDVCSTRGQLTCCNRNLPACRYNKLLSAPSGVINSPGYPLRYPHNTVFVWRITVPDGFLVQLNFTKIKIQRGSCSSCQCDYVAIADGPCLSSYRGRWCGSVGKPPSFMSTGRHLLLLFKSDSTINHDGFVAEYRRALKCGGEKPYSCLDNRQPACCKTLPGHVSSSTKLCLHRITMVIMATAFLLM